MYSASAARSEVAGLSVALAPCTTGVLRSAVMASYRQVQVIEATSGASGVTIRGFSMFSEFGGAVHGSTHTPASSMS